MKMNPVVHFEMPYEDEKRVAEFYPKSVEGASKFPSVVIQIDDIKNSMKMINEAGGKALGGPMDIPGIGKYVAFLDTEGNRVGMLEPSR